MLLFWLVFVPFVLALVGWAALTVRWALRRDRERRASQVVAKTEG